jgi:D-alanyl-D-alanine carboxypeptidase
MAVAPTSAPPASPTGKIEARLPSVSEIAIARAEPPPALAQPLPPAPVAQHARRETARAPASAWVIQLGAMDDEDKAKSMLEEAKSRSGRSLAHAAPFTEKVVRDGTTLYRARFSGFDEADDAQEACRHLKRSGFACFATRS